MRSADEAASVFGSQSLAWISESDVKEHLVPAGIVELDLPYADMRYNFRLCSPVVRFAHSRDETTYAF
jgi:hypothetical protein